MSNKISFWAVFELVTVSQIGSGLLLPATLASYGALSLYGWGISTIGAIFLAIMFALLCMRYPRKGGPHAYVKEAFGSSAAFFTGWTYWIISWISTIAIITSAVGYLIPLIGIHSPFIQLSLELFIILSITAINLKGVYNASKTKFSLIALQMILLLAVPLLALFFFDIGNFTPIATTAEENSINLNNVILLTMWGFIGFETATTAAEDVENPSKTYPLALILGTLFVALVYFVSSLGIMGAIPGAELMNSQAPYTDTIAYLFGGQWHLIISMIAFIICLKSVNAWTLASGQIALGITQDGLMPQIFAKTNKHGAPVLALLISCAGTVVLLFLCQEEALNQKVTTIINLSVTCFLFVYAISCLAFLRLLWQQKRQKIWWQWLCGLISLSFCLWIIYSSSLKTLFVSSLFVLSGLPVYLLLRHKFKTKTTDLKENLSTC